MYRGGKSKCVVGVFLDGAKKKKLWRSEIQQREEKSAWSLATINNVSGGCLPHMLLIWRHKLHLINQNTREAAESLSSCSTAARLVSLYPRHSHKKTQNQQNTIATIIKNGNCEAGRWLFDYNMCILLCYLYLCVFFNASSLMCSCEFYNRACKNMMYCYRFNSLTLNKNSGTSIKYNNKSCFHDNLWVAVTTAINLYYKCKIKVSKLSRSIATFTWAKDHLV